jgi:hypothetical protein
MKKIDLQSFFASPGPPCYIQCKFMMEESNSEAEMPYFPTSTEWMQAWRPSKIPLSERFPVQYAVHTLPTASTKQDPPLPDPPWERREDNRASGSQNHMQKGKGPTRRERKDNPNCIPLSRTHEEGELTSQEQYEYQCSMHLMYLEKYDSDGTPFNPDEGWC